MVPPTVLNCQSQNQSAQDMRKAALMTGRGWIWVVASPISCGQYKEWELRCLVHLIYDQSTNDAITSWCNQAWQDSNWMVQCDQPFFDKLVHLYCSRLWRSTPMQVVMRIGHNFQPFTSRSKLQLPLSYPRAANMPVALMHSFDASRSTTTIAHSNGHHERVNLETLRVMLIYIACQSRSN